MKAMISQPMNGKTGEEIFNTRACAVKVLETNGYKVINTYFTDEWHRKEKLIEQEVVNIPLNFLAESLECMSMCNAVYFCKGWKEARGCRIEHDAAKAYGLIIFYEDENDI